MSRSFASCRKITRRSSSLSSIGDFIDVFLTRQPELQRTCTLSPLPRPTARDLCFSNDIWMLPRARFLLDESVLVVFCQLAIIFGHSRIHVWEGIKPRDATSLDQQVSWVPVRSKPDKNIKEGFWIFKVRVLSEGDVFRCGIFLRSALSR